jgi:hypothetical protein
MADFGIADEDEQSEQERLEVSRRYREQRGRDLRELAQPHLSREALEAGEFSTVPIEALAAVPFLGAFLALATRLRPARRGLSRNVLLALDSERLHLLSIEFGLEGTRATPVSSWPRGSVRVGSIEPKFMREAVRLEIDGREPLTLYASSLRTNPWAAALLRALGGEVPDPRDLGAGTGD